MTFGHSLTLITLIEYIPLQQGLRLSEERVKRCTHNRLIEYIPLQQGLRQHRCYHPLIL